MIATIHVCRSCKDRVRGAGGDHQAIDLMTAIAARLNGVPGFRVVPQTCLGPCGDGVRVAVTQPGHWGWLFQGLQQGADLDAFVTFLHAWRTSPAGVLAKADRPPLLLRKTIGRIPPSSPDGAAPHPGRPTEHS